MATLGLFENGISNGMMTYELQSSRHLRRGSQPAAFQSYRRDSFTREPIQSNRRSSITPREPMHGYRRDSLTRDPIQAYRRDSITGSQLQNNYRRDSLTSEPVDLVKAEVSGRRGSDADDLNWIAKYQKSDHHTDRLVNTKIEYDKAFGRNSAAQTDDKIRPVSKSSSYNPVSVPTNNSQLGLPPLNPVRYEGTKRLTVFLQPIKSDSLYRKSEDIERSIGQRVSSYYPSTPVSSGGIYSSSLTDMSNSYPSSMASRLDHGGAFRRQSSVTGSSVPASSVFSRRNSVDSNLYKTSRPSDFPSRLERGYSPITSLSTNDYRSPLSSKYMTEPTQTSSYRPPFSRAPSLPPSLSNTLTSGNAVQSSSSFSSSGSSRSTAVNDPASDIAMRRSSLASLSDLSSSRYRRSLDFGATKSSSSGFKSPYLSALGSYHHRNISNESTSPLSTLSSLSSFSSLLSSPQSSLPPPSERIFGARNSHSSIRKSRRSVI